jgi:5-methylcytosine-specific restriction endonuclease McrA
VSTALAQRQRHLWKEARAAGETILCGICEEPITSGKRNNRGGITVDHIIPLALGGPDTIRNMQPAHSKCNVVKGDLLTFKKEEIVRIVDRLIRKNNVVKKV